MKQIKTMWKAALLIAGAALVTILLWIAGTAIFVGATYAKNADSGLPVGEVSDALVRAEGGYRFSAEERLDARGMWAMLIGEDGAVLWSCNKPAEVSDRYGINQVAAFSKWYLNDYPVQCRIRDDGLFVLAAPKFSTWKYNLRMDNALFGSMVVWTAVMLALSLLCVIGLSVLLLRHWNKKEQRAIDEARADWINGVSHDIRTPLSLVMGYSSRLSENQSLSAEARKQAEIILSQSQAIKELVGDLNLTMRLSHQMEPLRREAVDPIALLRQAAADLLNTGIDARYRLELDAPESRGETVFADAPLLKRAIKNLLDNCVRHNADGCDILLRLCRDAEHWVFTVESRGVKPVAAAAAQEAAERGESAHGTGLKLVRQIAAAHGGSAGFDVCGSRFRCQMKIPTGGNPL